MPNQCGFSKASLSTNDGHSSNDTIIVGIIGGTESIPNAWPWQVYLNDGKYSCSATLINQQWLLTAAHCQLNLASWYAYLGEHDIKESDGEVKIKISHFIQVKKGPCCNIFELKDD